MQSPCAQIEIPILNRARAGPLAIISPSNTHIGLTRPSNAPPWSGWRGEPDVYYPTGERNYARVLGKKMQKAGDVPVAGGTNSTATTPPEVAKAQKQLNALQWAIPGLTGAMLASSSLHEEQQRPSQVIGGTIKGLPSAVGTAATGAALAAKHKVQDVL